MSERREEREFALRCISRISETRFELTNSRVRGDRLPPIALLLARALGLGCRVEQVTAQSRLVAMSALSPSENDSHPVAELASPISLLNGGGSDRTTIVAAVAEQTPLTVRNFIRLLALAWPQGARQIERLLWATAKSRQGDESEFEAVSSCRCCCVPTEKVCDILHQL